MAEASGLKKRTRFDGRLHVFERPNSPFLWCGFHHKGRYVRQSTKERHWSAATKVAEKWFTLKQAELLTGVASFGGKSFSSAAKETIKTLEARVARGERSPTYLVGVKKEIDRNIVPFFGSFSVDSIGIVQWEKYKAHCYKQNPNLSRATIHQRKNALRLVLNESYRQGWIKQIPVIKDVYDNEKVKVPRTWFNGTEYTRLHNAIRSHKRTLTKTRWKEDCDELYDYVIFVANSGLRVGEARNVRFCDVSVHEEDDGDVSRKYLMIRNIKGKRGTGDCRTMDGAVAAFERRVAARSIKKPKESTEPLFKAYHRDMFNSVLAKTNLKMTKEQPPRKRDLTVLRHTYISFRLLNGASIYDIATNCRTSPAMISEHYAKWISPQMMTGLNRLNKKNVKAPSVKKGSLEKFLS